jgi:hypothetical protein
MFNLLINGQPVEKDYEAAKASPFASYNNESHVLVRPDRQTNINEINFLIQQGIIGEFELQIIKALNRLTFATSKQITEYLNHLGLETEQKKVARKLNFLWDKSVVDKVEFQSLKSPHLKSAYKIYALGYHGKALLKLTGVEPKHFKSFLANQAYKIKAALSSNQLLLEMLGQDLIKEMEGSMYIFIEASNVCIFCSGIGYGDKEYVIHSVRKIDNWEEDLTGKIKRYEHILGNYADCNWSFKSVPELILQCESPSHLEEVRSLIKAEGSSLNIKYTYDKATVDMPDQLFVI